MTRYCLPLVFLIAAATTASAAQSSPAATATRTALAAKPLSSSILPVRQRAGILVDLKGRGLYNFDGDTPGKSNCVGQCLLLWPPILARADANAKGDLSLVVRDDGQKQWAWKGKPLYRWVSDQKRGDAGGDGINGVWHLVRLPPAVPPSAPEPIKPGKN